MALVWLLALFSIVLSASAQVLMKVGMAAIRHEASSGPSPTVFLMQRAMVSPHVLAGLALYGLSAILWLYVLSRFDLSLAYPLVSLGFVLVAVLSWGVLGESLSLERIAGIGLILVGVVLVGRG